MLEPDDDIRYKIRALKAIYMMFSKENQDRLRNLLNLEKDGADIVQMRELVMTIALELTSIPEKHDTILQDLVRYFQR